MAQVREPSRLGTFTLHYADRSKFGAAVVNGLAQRESPFPMRLRLVLHRGGNHAQLTKRHITVFPWSVQARQLDPGPHAIGRSPIKRTLGALLAQWAVSADSLGLLSP